MSDFHKLIITILKVKPDKLPRIIKYRDYKNFKNKTFNNKLKVSLKNFDMDNSSFTGIKIIFMRLLKKLPLLQTKYIIVLINPNL